MPVVTSSPLKTDSDGVDVMCIPDARCDDLTAVYGGRSATVTRQNVDDVEPRNPPADKVRRQGTTVPVRADNYKQGE